MIPLTAIVETVGGHLDGDPSFTVHSLMSLEKADCNALTFFVGQGDAGVPDTDAGAILLSPRYASQFTINKIIVENPYLAYAKVSQLFSNVYMHQTGVSADARISQSAVIGADPCIGPFSVIGSQAVLGNSVIIGSGVHIGCDVHIGDGTVIEDRVVVASRCVIGRQCCISAGAVIGSSGFGYAQDGPRWEKIEQLGRVVMGNRVDVGANTTIDRGALDNTVIGDGVKMDNLIQIAHNVQVGEDTAIAGCVGVAGSTRIGKRCKIGGRVAILGHLEISDEVTVLANSTVTRSIQKKGEYASMVPVQPARLWRKNLAVLRKLDRLIRGISKEINIDWGNTVTTRKRKPRNDSAGTYDE